MKRTALVREPTDAGCRLVRHGKKHDSYVNANGGRKAPVPWHTEIADTLCRLITKQLGVD